MVSTARYKTVSARLYAPIGRCLRIPSLPGKSWVLGGPRRPWGSMGPYRAPGPDARPWWWPRFPWSKAPVQRLCKRLFASSALQNLAGSPSAVKSLALKSRAPWTLIFLAVAHLALSSQAMHLPHPPPRPGQGAGGPRPQGPPEAPRGRAGPRGAQTPLGPQGHPWVPGPPGAHGATIGRAPGAPDPCVSLGRFPQLGSA